MRQWRFHIGWIPLLLNSSLVFSAATVNTIDDTQYAYFDVITLSLDSDALSVDEDGNLLSFDHSQKISNGGSGNFDLIEFNASSFYTSSSVVVSYTTTSTDGPVDVDYLPASDEYAIAENDISGDSGQVTIVDSSGNIQAVIEMPDFRPAAISHQKNSNGILYIVARKNTAPLHDHVYRIIPPYPAVVDSTTLPYISNVRARGIAVNESGDVYVSTPNGSTTVTGWLTNSLYRIPFASITPGANVSVSEFIAEFSDRMGDALEIDNNGFLVALQKDLGNPGNTQVGAILQATDIANNVTLSVLTNLNFSSRSLEFDSTGNIYTADKEGAPDNGFGIGSRDIFQFTAASQYANSSLFLSYETDIDDKVTGINFSDSSSELFVSERNTNGNSGDIREINIATETVINTSEFTDARPTGLEVDSQGNILVSLRRESEPSSYGEIYSVPALVLGPTFSGRDFTPLAPINSLAIEKAGDTIFIATPVATETIPAFLSGYSYYSYDPSFDAFAKLVEFQSNQGRELRMLNEDTLCGVGTSISSFQSLVVCLDLSQLPTGFGPGDNSKTNPGNSVTASPDPNVNVTFDTVTGAGQTEVTTSTIIPSSSNGIFVTLGDYYYDITTTATVSGNVEICLIYDDSDFEGQEENPDIIRIRHLIEANLADSDPDNDWEDLTTTLFDDDEKQICGITSSLSWFTLGLSPDTDEDGLSDETEMLLGTDIEEPDTDEDGISDFDEVNQDGDPTNYTIGTDTDPNNEDTDGDGINDSEDNDPLVPQVSVPLSPALFLLSFFAILLLAGIKRQALTQ